MPWKRMLAYITGSVNEDLLRRIEYLLEENRVLRGRHRPGQCLKEVVMRVDQAGQQ